jgi:hypothetical protein
MAHSNELCEFVLTDHGLTLGDEDQRTTSNDVESGWEKGRDRHGVA